MDNFPDPALIGQAFVRQYYTQMHKEPCQMHRFYMSNSSFVHGGSDIGSEEPVIGQTNIHEKILSLDLQQVHAKIKQVDAHSTLQNGIVVQVTGELSIKGHPMRAFVQTFVLAQQKEKSFYVHNDIFRYQDDDLVSESETNEMLGDPEPPLIDTSENCDFPVEDNIDDGFTNELLPATPTPAATQEVTPPGGWSQYDTALTEVTQNGVGTVTPPHEFPSANEPVVEARQEQETFPVVAVETPEPDNKASTWASRLAQKQQQSANRPISSTAIPTTQALPQRDPRPRRTDSNRPQTQQHQQPLTSGIKDKKAPPFSRGDSGTDTSQLFVGGLPHNTTESELRQLFQEFGSVRDVRINPKNFAFIVFNESKPVTDLMARNKNSLEIRGKSLNIEEKRAPRGGRMGGGSGVDRNRGNSGGGMGGNKPRGGGVKNQKR